MAKVAITATVNYIKLVFNDNAAGAGLVQTYISVREIEEVSLTSEGVILHTRGTHYTFSYDGTFGYKIDTVAAVVPASNVALCDAIGALIK